MKGLKEFLLSDFNERFNKKYFFGEIYDILKLCSYLDHRFKSLYF
jgi:hypothetical protein